MGYQFIATIIYVYNQRDMILKGFEMTSIMDALSAEEFDEDDPFHDLWKHVDFKCARWYIAYVFIGIFIKE